MSWIHNRFRTQTLGAVDGELDPDLRAGQENDQHFEAFAFWKSFEAACVWPIRLTFEESRARHGVDAASGRPRPAADPLADGDLGLLAHPLDHVGEEPPVASDRWPGHTEVDLPARPTI